MARKASSKPESSAIPDLGLDSHFQPKPAQHKSANLPPEGTLQVVSEAKDNMADFVLANVSVFSNQTGKGDFESALSLETVNISNQATA